MITTSEIKLFALCKKENYENYINVYDDIYCKCINIIISKNKKRYCNSFIEQRIYLSVLNYILPILEDLLFEKNMNITYSNLKLNILNFIKEDNEIENKIFNIHGFNINIDKNEIINIDNTIELINNDLDKLNVSIKDISNNIKKIKSCIY